MLSQAALRLTCTLLSLLQIEKLLTTRLRFLDAAVILNLHNITPHPNPFWPGITPEQFDELLSFAIQKFQIVTIGNLVDGEAARRRRPCLILSFDDGYYDFLEYAVPILERYKVSA